MLQADISTKFSMYIVLPFKFLSWIGRELAQAEK